MAAPKIVADLTLQLTSALAVGGTTATISSNVDDDGVTLQDGKYFFTVDGNNSAKEHIVCTKTGTSLSAIATVSRQGVETAGALRAHRVGATVVMTDFATYKDYIDQATISGISPATTSVLGGVYTTTNTGGSVVVSTDDTRVPTQGENDALAGTSGTPSSSNKFVTNDDFDTRSALKTQLKFGGTGADGVLAITSGATNIDCANAKIVVKNYSSISITGTGSLTFTNPNTSGTIVILKSSGAVTLTSSAAPMIDMRLMGAQSYSYNGFGFFTTGSGTGGTGQNSGGSASVSAGGVGNSLYYSLYSKDIILFTGGSGGNGGTYGGSAGVGGKGGGGLYIECAGALNFTTAGGISVAGQNGTGGSGGSSSGNGGGGGGAGGCAIILYNTLTSASGTITIAGGTGGNGFNNNAGQPGAGGGNGLTGGSGTGGAGSAQATNSYGGGGAGGGSGLSVADGGNGTTNAGGGGASGYSLVALNTEFA